jgi:hypothetical protein
MPNPRRPSKNVDRTRDDLPMVHVARLRAAGAITRASTSIELAFGELRLSVEIVHRDFPPTRAGKPRSWSYFRCPSCNRRARILRLSDGRLTCWRCDGLIYRCQAFWRYSKPFVAERLRAKLYGSRRVANRPAVERELRRRLIADRKARLDGFEL